MHRKVRIAALLAAVSLSLSFGLAACRSSGATAPRHVVASDHGNFEASNAQGCGIERWAVKTGTDASASQVNMTPQDTTVANMVALSVPAGFNEDASRLVGSAEMQVWKLSATLVSFKEEADSDYHLVLHDDQGNSMIAEIPDPACVGQGSPFLAGITKARAQFNARYTANGSMQPAGVPVTVTGVGFFDTIHGQTGVAPNGIELHPVLQIQFGS